MTIEPGKEFNSKFGSYRHADLIGIPFGSKVGSRTGKGFIHVLRPTPELWTMALPHRTQILYLADIAFITSYLDVKKGSRVIEAGRSSFRIQFISSLSLEPGSCGVRRISEAHLSLSVLYFTLDRSSPSSHNTFFCKRALSELPANRYT